MRELPICVVQKLIQIGCKAEKKKAQQEQGQSCWNLSICTDEHASSAKQYQVWVEKLSPMGVHHVPYCALH